LRITDDSLSNVLEAAFDVLRDWSAELIASAFVEARRDSCSDGDAILPNGINSGIIKLLNGPSD
jgi:hypothetical protein